MKKIIWIFILFPVLATGGVFDQADLSAQEQAEREIMHWTCGMHPSVKEGEAGKCPICNMDLVPVFAEKEVYTDQGRVVVRVSPSAARLAGVRTVAATRRMLMKSINAPASITYDETEEFVISARFGGRIEKLYADYAGMKIEKGDPLALIYSPELISAQREFLLAADSEYSSAARRKLLLWGITEAQIDELEKREDVIEKMAIYAEASGTLIHSRVERGDYVKEGTILFHINDISSVWAVADLYGDEIALVREGMKASLTIDSFPGESREGLIAFVEPFIDNQIRSARVRVELDNSDSSLMPGMIAAMNIEAPLQPPRRKEINHEMGEMKSGSDCCPTEMKEEMGRAHDIGKSMVLSVPKSAVINTGTRSIVFIEESEGVYRLRRIRLGDAAGGYYAVLEGLEEGERVVERGSFLIDSQSRLTGQAEEEYGGALGKENKDQGHVH